MKKDKIAINNYKNQIFQISIIFWSHMKDQKLLLPQNNQLNKNKNNYP